MDESAHHAQLVCMNCRLLIMCTMILAAIATLPVIVYFEQLKEPDQFQVSQRFQLYKAYEARLSEKHSYCSDLF